MPTYEKRKGGKVRARVRVEPFPVQSKTFDRKEDARLWAEPLEADLKKKKRAGLLQEELYTYADLIDDYLKYRLPKRKTAVEVFRHQALWWRSEIGSKTLAEVRTTDIAEKRDKLLTEPVYTVDINGNAIGRFDKKTNRPKYKAPGTVIKYLNALSVMCRHNINERGWLRSNPVLPLEKPEVKNDRARFLSDKEKAVLLTACKASSNSMLYPIVLFALCTGARRGEVLKLKLSDINPDYTRATLRDTKNGDTRAVHITPYLRECLREHCSRVAAIYDVVSTDVNWVFPRGDLQAPISIRHAWRYARKQAIKKQPSLADFRFHDLRHTFASYLAMSGATLIELMHALGHKSLNSVQRYAHLTEDHTQAVVLRMAELRFALPKPANDNEEENELEETG